MTPAATSILGETWAVINRDMGSRVCFAAQTIWLFNAYNLYQKEGASIGMVACIAVFLYYLGNAFVEAARRNVITSMMSCIQTQQALIKQMLDARKKPE